MYTLWGGGRGKRERESNTKITADKGGERGGEGRTRRWRVGTSQGASFLFFVLISVFFSRRSWGVSAQAEAQRWSNNCRSAPLPRLVDPIHCLYVYLVSIFVVLLIVYYFAGRDFNYRTNRTVETNRPIDPSIDQVADRPADRKNLSDDQWNDKMTLTYR